MVSLDHSELNWMITINWLLIPQSLASLKWGLSSLNRIHCVIHKFTLSISLLSRLHEFQWDLVDVVCIDLGTNPRTIVLACIQMWLDQRAFDLVHFPEYTYYSHLLDIIITMTSLWEHWRLKSPASLLFTYPFIETQIKENIKAQRHWPLCGEFTGDRWIPRINGQ